MKINTLIVDDEPLARERIRTLLKDEPEFDIAGEAANGKEALKKIQLVTIDLLFLDIQMPELDGIRLIEKLTPAQIPLIIFTTAYDSFAVKAFELNAMDYLLKPFTKKRFQQSLQRVKEQFSSDDKDLYSSTMLSTLQAIVQKKQYPERIVVKSEGKIQFIPLKDIMWAESDANYININTIREKVVMRETMTNLSQKLDPAIFLRTHRSVLVNVEFIKEMKPWFNDELVILLHNGTQLPVGRTYRKNVLQSLH
ncbi:MAG: response regulator [Ignavibacteriales bacterium]|nr:response regulator [Ignavibacteriales bacterium]